MYVLYCIYSATGLYISTEIAQISYLIDCSVYDLMLMSM